MWNLAQTVQTRSFGLLISDVESSYGRPVLFYKINIIPVVCNFDYKYKSCSDVVCLCEAELSLIASVLVHLIVLDRDLCYYYQYNYLIWSCVSCRMTAYICLIWLHSLTVSKQHHDTIQYKTMEEFNMDSIAECDQLNLAHVASNKKV